jgi:hypothetical protein
MEIRRANKFDDYGCYFTGNLAIVDHIERADEIASKQPLYGFGRGSCLDSLGEAKTLINKEGLTIKRVLLGIPVLVVEVEEHE